MKSWLKKNWNNLIGNFFVWLVPLIVILIMSFGGTKQETTLKFKFSFIGIVIAIIYLLVYVKKLKKALERQKTIQIAKNGRVKVWIRLIEWVSYILPYVIFLVLIVALKGVYEKVYDDLVMFIVITMVSATIGYVILCIDTTKEQD